jgi:DNA-binding MarR family transcriptional regulator
MIAAILAALRAIDGDIDRMDDVAATRLGVSRTDFRCLDVLSRGALITPGQLATEMGLSTGATTALLDRLEKKGFIGRERDLKDRRRVLIKPSRRAAAQVWPIFQDVVEDSTRLLSQFQFTELETILRFLEKQRTLIREHLPPEGTS